MNRLKDILDKVGVSMRDVSALLECDRPYASKCISTGTLSSRNTEKLCDALGLAYGDVMEWQRETRESSKEQERRRAMEKMRKAKDELQAMGDCPAMD